MRVSEQHTAQTISDRSGHQQLVDPSFEHEAATSFYLSTNILLAALIVKMLDGPCVRTYNSVGVGVEIFEALFQTPQAATTALGAEITAPVV